LNVEINGQRLREIRREKAIERKELEEMSGVHFATIVRIELGQSTARLATAKKIADALGVEPAEIIGREVVNAG
jgi:transcriptional regulator with XRE-family HTH domain